MGRTLVPCPQVCQGKFSSNSQEGILLGWNFLLVYNLHSLFLVEGFMGLVRLGEETDLESFLELPVLKLEAVPHCGMLNRQDPAPVWRRS